MSLTNMNKSFTAGASIAKKSFYNASLIKDFLENIDKFLKPLTKEVNDILNDKLYHAINEYLKREGRLIFRKKEYTAFKNNSLKHQEFVKYEYWLVNGVPLKFYHSGLDISSRIVFPLFVDVDRFFNRVKEYVEKIDWSSDKSNIEFNPLYYLTDDSKKIVSEVKFWLDKRSWFYSKGIPYKRTYLLIGSPGTGKSKFIRNLSDASDLPLSKVDILSVFGNVNKNKKEMSDFSTFPTPKEINPIPYSNSILLMEDIDRVDFQRIRLDNLLNYLDGINDLDGKLVFITCNDESKIPEALKRPGRVDKIVYFKKFDDEGLLHIASNILGPEKAEDTLRLYKSSVCETDIDKKNMNSPAHFTKFCTDLSIREFEDTLNSQ